MKENPWDTISWLRNAWQKGRARQFGAAGFSCHHGWQDERLSAGSESPTTLIPHNVLRTAEHKAVFCLVLPTPR